MKTIISPAMKMKVDRDTFAVRTKASLLEQTKILKKFMQTRNYDELKTIWHASDRVTKQGQDQLKVMSLNKRMTPAILSFSGIQYQYMAPDLFTEKALDFLQDNVWIMSGFYGALRPFDGVTPYRLEMKDKLLGFKEPNLYKFWGSKIADLLFANDDLLINLASNEYSKAIKPYLGEKRLMISIDFQEKKNEVWKTVGVHAKMARGAMIKFIAENGLTKPEELADFHDFGFNFVETMSDNEHYVFRTKKDFKHY